MEVLDSTVRHQQTMLNIKICLFVDSFVESLLHKAYILGMNSLKYQLQGWRNGSIVSKDVVGFLRPVDLSANNAPAETTRVTYALPLSQESFAALQSLMCFLAVINIRNQVIPTDDTAFRVSQWKAAYVEPAVY